MPDLLVEGTLYTLDPARPKAQAALVRGGRFVRVGTLEQCEREAMPDVQVVSVGAGCAVPGMVDAHGHPALHGRTLAQVRLAGARSEEECVARVVARASVEPEGNWLLGSGWDQNGWPRRAFPEGARLSQEVPLHPVVLSRVDVHAIWCNEAALRRAGITDSTPDPAGGKIVRRSNGSASGVLIDNAMDLVRNAIPRPTASECELSILRSFSDLSAAGLTGVHDAAASPEALEAYRKLALSNELALRVYAMIDGQVPRERLVEQMVHWRSQQSIGKLTVRSVKLFADGALGSRGAAMFEPYNDDSGNVGLWLMEPADLAERITLVAAHGFQPSVHCIGDKACNVVLEAFARVPRELRPRAEHLQILRHRDLPLLKRSGAIASMQPTHATSDGPWAEERLGRGNERQRGAYAWRTVLDAGVPLAFGSDFPIESFDPRLGLRAAVTRKTSVGGIWMPEQRLSREDALRAFTTGAAYAEFAENRRGVIREGMDADLTVFGRDLFAVPAEELPTVPVVATVVEGQVEHA